MSRNNIDYIMFAPAYPPLIGGVERHVYEIHKELGNKGFKGKIYVINNKPKEIDIKEDIAWLEPKKLLGWIPRTKRINIIWKISCAILKNRKAKIHFHYFGTFYYMIPFLKLFRVINRSYITFHGWGGKYPINHKTIKKRKECTTKSAGSINIGHFIERWYGTRADIVSYGGVDIDKYYYDKQPSLNREKIKIAYIGRFAEDTGIYKLILGVKEYCKRYKNMRIELHLFGDGNISKTLLHIDENIKLTIKVENPIIDSSLIIRDYEIIFACGYLTILEALCANRIVFSYYNDSIREDYLRMHPVTSSLFICGDEDSFIDGLNRCVNKSSDVLKKCESGWEWSKKQTWAKLAGKYISLWQQRIK